MAESTFLLQSQYLTMTTLDCSLQEFRLLKSRITMSQCCTIERLRVMLIGLLFHIMGMSQRNGQSQERVDKSM